MKYRGDNLAIGYQPLFSDTSIIVQVSIEDSEGNLILSKKNMIRLISYYEYNWRADFVGNLVIKFYNGDTFLSSLNYTVKESPIILAINDLISSKSISKTITKSSGDLIYFEIEKSSDYVVGGYQSELISTSKEDGITDDVVNESYNTGGMSIFDVTDWKRGIELNKQKQVDITLTETNVLTWYSETAKFTIMASSDMPENYEGEDLTINTDENAWVVFQGEASDSIQNGTLSSSFYYSSNHIPYFISNTDVITENDKFILKSGNIYSQNGSYGGALSNETFLGTFNYREELDGENLELVLKNNITNTEKKEQVLINTSNVDQKIKTSFINLSQQFSRNWEIDEEKIITDTKESGLFSLIINKIPTITSTGEITISDEKIINKGTTTIENNEDSIVNVIGKDLKSIKNLILAS